MWTEGSLRQELACQNACQKEIYSTLIYILWIHITRKQNVGREPSCNHSHCKGKKRKQAGHVVKYLLVCIYIYIYCISFPNLLHLNIFHFLYSSTKCTCYVIFLFSPFCWCEHLIWLVSFLNAFIIPICSDCPPLCDLFVYVSVLDSLSNLSSSLCRYVTAWHSSHSIRILCTGYVNLELSSGKLWHEISYLSSLQLLLPVL